ncbi:MAG: hypothetical protein WBA97_17990 [Actinophytocola sp.]|uniref:class I SAM-dependent methyltransferase n=1 Tax=Actinophytocola sp. TaxID=1872138 RepID=UPI003C76F828
MSVDFGPTATDYAKYRTGFPPEFFTRLAALGIGVPGQRVADLGTGTGALARELAAAGCVVTGVEVTYRVARAEDTGLPGGGWDVVLNPRLAGPEPQTRGSRTEDSRVLNPRLAGPEPRTRGF